LVATTRRRPNNIYILDKEKIKKIEVTQKSPRTITTKEMIRRHKRMKKYY
jgi:hypothetical protein